MAAPRPPDRWLPGARFSHAFHESVACADCHAAAKSERTSDVLIPTQQSCVRCHSPNGAGIPAQYPRLAGQNAEYAQAQLTAFRDGVRMNSIQMTQVAAKLNDREIKAVSDYIAGLH